MKINAVLAIELGQTIKNESDYINYMVKDLNLIQDHTLTKAKVYKEYKDIVISKFGKPKKFPCLVVNYFNDTNETITEFLYAADLKSEKKEYSDKVKLIQRELNKMVPAKKNNNNFTF